MKRIILIAILLSSITIGFSQNYQKIYKASFSDYSSSTNVYSNDGVQIIKTSDGNYLTVGNKVLKTEPDGTVLWGKTFTGVFNDVIEDDGKYVAAGTLNNKIYVVKFEANGTTIWSKTYEAPILLSSSNNRAHAIKKSATGYVIGGYGSLFGLPMLMDIDIDGNLNWINLYSEANRTIGVIHDIEVLSNNDILITGSTNDRSSGLNNFFDTYLMRVNSTGGVVWEKSFTNDAATMAFSITKGPGSTYFCAGGVNINEAPTNEGVVFVFNDAGSLLHANKYAAPGDGLLYDVVYNASNSTAYAVGEVSGFHQNKNQAFMVTTDADAKLIRAVEYGKIGAGELALGILIDGSNIVMAGLAFETTAAYSLKKTDLDGNAIHCLQYVVEPTEAALTFTSTALTSTVTEVKATTTVVDITEGTDFTTFAYLDRLLSVQVDVLKEDCNNSGIASIKLTASGSNDVNFYTVKFDGINKGSMNPITISDITGGEHTIKVDDYQECAFTETITIASNPAPFSITLDEIQESCEVSKTGAIYTTLNNGSVYSFLQWSNGYNSQNITNIGPGEYTLITKDILTKCFTTDVFTVGFTASETATDMQTACNSFTWIDGNTYTESNNSATFYDLGAADDGCDKLITLDLTLNTIDITVEEDGSSLTANELDATYRWLDCNNNNEAVPDETSRTFQTSANGSYAVEVTGVNCVDTSACYTIQSVGISNIVGENIHIYPNPAKDQLFINTNDIEIENITIISLTGKKMRLMNKSTNTVNVSNLPNGIYFLKIETSIGISHKRFIKE